MPPLKSFKIVLQSNFTLEDHSWSYQVANLPTDATQKSSQLIKSLEIVSNPETTKLELRFLPIDSNRALSEPIFQYIHFSFADFRLGAIKDEVWQPYTARESAGYLAKLLKKGISINGVLYSFYGHSSSQLRSRSCYLLRGTLEQVSEKVEALGDFSKIKTVAKKAKRIGLLFSSCNATLHVPDGRYEDIDDVEREGYTFTDGCGLGSKQFFALLSQKMHIIVRNKRYLPSVVQIRFRGYKGVLTLDPTMRKEIWIQFRHSMRKFTGTSDDSFAVVAHSKPYTYGFLNDDIILLLHSLGISEETFIRKQAAHFGYLQQSLEDPVVAFRLLCSLDRLALAETLLIQGIESVRTNLKKIVTNEYNKMVNKRSLPKCRILVPRARLLFGVCDPRGILKPGECFLRVTQESCGGEPMTIKNCNVLVTRNPCLHPGDMRKLKAVDCEGLAHLHDCIVFSTRGARPAADKMSGGDLDGDTFFVCWDPELVPSTISQAAEYPPGREAMNFEKITAADRIDYLASYSSASLGRVKKLHLEWAIPARGGPQSQQCQELNRLHSLCVDGNRVRVPQRLEDLPEVSQSDRDSFILEVLHRHASNASKPQSLRRPDFTPLDSRDFVEKVLCEPRACPEIDILQMVLRWCATTKKAQLVDFLSYINLDALTGQQRQWLIQQIPPTSSLESYMMNSLTRSDLLSIDEIAPYHLDYPGMRWKCIFSSFETRLANLLEALSQSFSLFHRKLLVIRVTERFSIAIYVPKQVEFEAETPLGPAARILAFAHTDSRRNRIIAPTADYRVSFDHSRFEIYNRKRQDTFIFLGRAQNDEESYRGVQGAANRARERQKTLESGKNHDFVTSIALGKFSRQVQDQIGRVRREGILAAELYVISNSDVQSFRILDLWLESIDTTDKKPLFEKAAPIYIPRRRDLDLAVYPPGVERLFQGHFEVLDDRVIRDRLSEILRICYDFHESNLVSKIYQHYLNPNNVSNPDVITTLLDNLYMAPANVIHFTGLCPWPDIIKRCLKSKMDIVIDSLLQSSVSIGMLITESFKLVLNECSISNMLFRELVEKTSLLVRDPDLIFSIYFDCLEPMTEKLSSVNADYFARNLFGIGLDHFDEANERKKGKLELWTLGPVTDKDDARILKCERRIDAPQMERLATGDHVRFYLASETENVILPQKPSFDALVEVVEVGLVTFRCLSQPTSVPLDARWRLHHCGSFVTSKAMLDAVLDLIDRKEEVCPLYRSLFGLRLDSVEEYYQHFQDDSLNESQLLAVNTSLRCPLTCIWGPPGTGKTHTIVVLLNQLLSRFPKSKILVTAPTHNAVDNVLRKFLKGESQVKPVRVSTNIRKVASDLVQYTCDAMEGKELAQNHKARQAAMERLDRSRLIFTTCAGAGLGLLRGLTFPIVIIDEASQQVEPVSLIPLVKGCEKAILVGDHVQLRATVRKHAKAADFDVSLFERLYSSEMAGVEKVMLNVQYRMHPDICKFPSAEFYGGKLLSAPSCQDRALPQSDFPWPETSRCVFIPCAESEDFGRQSKGNEGQAQLCKAVLKSLTATSDAKAKASIAVLTPYSRQVDLLKAVLPSSIVVSSIDGFQGQEADIIIFVTVRSNLHGDIGFLEDMRRLNVALTRAKAGLVVIGNKLTLESIVVTLKATPAEDDGNNNPSITVDPESKAIWKRLMRNLAVVEFAVEPPVI